MQIESPPRDLGRQQDNVTARIGADDRVRLVKVQAFRPPRPVHGDGRRCRHQYSNAVWTMVRKGTVRCCSGRTGKSARNAAEKDSPEDYRRECKSCKDLRGRRTPAVAERFPEAQSTIGTGALAHLSLCRYFLRIAGRRSAVCGRSDGAAGRAPALPLSSIQPPGSIPSAGKTFLILLCGPCPCGVLCSCAVQWFSRVAGASGSLGSPERPSARHAAVAARDDGSFQDSS